jgi:uncharacterized protein involved in high-affinity Fe2+ transport
MSVLGKARAYGGPARSQARRCAPVAAAWTAALLAGVLCAGCASSTAAADGAGARQGMTASAGPSAASAAASAGGAGMSGMSGMNVGASTSASSAGGVRPVPTQALGTTVWQGMKITAMAMTPVPFLTYNGTSMQEVKPAKNTSFHLMVTLNDAQTGVVIPYASVWATITEGTAMPFDESLWPMISRYMGPHYGNDVSLPGGGAYKLTLLISPPVSARHLEYQDVWVKPHKVSFTFHWQPAS